MSILPSSAAVQARLQELREKEELENAKRHAEALEKSLHLEKEERERVEEVKRVVAASIVDWEAEVLLALEKIPNLLEIIKNPPPYPAIRGNRFYQKPFQIELFLTTILSGKSEGNIPTSVTVEHEQARFRLRTVARIIQETTAKEARIKAEAIAVQQTAYTELTRIKINNMVMTFLDSHPNLRTISHNFTDSKGAPSTLFVAYTESPRSRERYLRVLKATQNGIEDPYICYEAGSFTGPSASPPPIPVPSSWATQYETGMIPFHPVCPTCGKATLMYKREYRSRIDHIGHGTDSYNGGQVECKEHYKWQSATNTHYKWESYPLHVPDHIIRSTTYPTGKWVQWDPRDPDGSIAAAAAREAMIATKEAEIAKIQAELAALRRS